MSACFGFTISFAKYLMKPYFRPDNVQDWGSTHCPTWLDCLWTGIRIRWWMRLLAFQCHTYLRRKNMLVLQMDVWIEWYCEWMNWWLKCCAQSLSDTQIAIYHTVHLIVIGHLVRFPNPLTLGSQLGNLTSFGWVVIVLWVLFGCVECAFWSALINWSCLEKLLWHHGAEWKFKKWLQKLCYCSPSLSSWRSLNGFA